MTATHYWTIVITAVLLGIFHSVYWAAPEPQCFWWLIPIVLCQMVLFFWAPRKTTNCNRLSGTISMLSDSRNCGIEPKFSQTSIKPIVKGGTMRFNDQD